MIAQLKIIRRDGELNYDGNYLCIDQYGLPHLLEGLFYYGHDDPNKVTIRLGIDYESVSDYHIVYEVEVIK